MLAPLFALALAVPQTGFDVVALGVQGGLAEDDLTSFLVSRAGANAWIGLDAGTVAAGLKEQPEPRVVLREQIKGWAITHPHLDHVQGLAIAVVEDPGPKPLFGLPSTIDGLRDHLFNNVLWVNFGNEGRAPLRRLIYQRLRPGTAAPVAGTGLTIEALPLAHAGVTSTMFLVEDGADAVAFFGDTGPDLVENSDKLDRAWRRLAPLIRGKKLRGIFIEVSYDNARKDTELFGHLTPRHLFQELGALALAVDPSSPSTALAGLPIVITHIKPTLGPGAPRLRIEAELQQANKLGVKLLLPRQGERFPL